jgi:hypothetical protein
MAMRGRRNSAGEDAARYTPSPAKQEDWSLLDHATACRHVAGFKNRSPAMKFGWLTLALSPSPDEDAVRIDQQIEQVCNAESLGFNDVWLTEHYFTRGKRLQRCLAVRIGPDNANDTDSHRVLRHSNAVPPPGPPRGATRAAR